MKKVFNILKEIFFVIWGFPQNLIGLIIFLLLRKKRYYNYKGSLVSVTGGVDRGAVSLGKFIFIFGNSVSQQTLRHERGHGLQSDLLGIFYLVVIGIPSIVWARCFRKYRIKNKVGYDWFYTEKWATYWGDKYYGW